VKLYKTYKDIIYEQRWIKLEKYLSEETILSEIDSVGLNQLLFDAKLLIFDAFGIKPSDTGKYFIAGSARLFKNPKLLKIINEIEKGMGLTDKNRIGLSIGDLDVVVPGKKEWDKLYENYNNVNSEFIIKLSKKIGKSPEEIKNLFLKQDSNWKQGIYRPGNGVGGMNLVDTDIEAFGVWDPSKISGSIKVRPTKEILSNSVKIGGYYYMSIRDVLHYKWQLKRDKEEGVLNLIGKLFKNIENIKRKPNETEEELEQRKYRGSEKLFKNIYNILGKKK